MPVAPVASGSVGQALDTVDRLIGMGVPGICLALAILTLYDIDLVGLDIDFFQPNKVANLQPYDVHGHFLSTLMIFCAFVRSFSAVRANFAHCSTTS